MGVQVALGASREELVSAAVRSGARVGAEAALLGALPALPAAALLRTLLLDVAPFEPLTYLAAAATLLL